jgi:hypothetical protein
MLPATTLDEPAVLCGVSRRMAEARSAATDITEAFVLSRNGAGSPPKTFPGTGTACGAADVSDWWRSRRATITYVRGLNMWPLVPDPRHASPNRPLAAGGAMRNQGELYFADWGARMQVPV